MDRPHFRSGPAQHAKRPVSKVDLIGEASSDYDGSASMSSDVRDAENLLLPPAEYDRLAPARVPRYQWFLAYRGRVPRSNLQV